MRLLIVAFLLLGTHIGHSASDRCQFFQLHKGFKRAVQKKCSDRSLYADTDYDGLPDWKRHPLFGDILYPNDPDIDNDGVPNVADPRPFRDSANDRTSDDLLPFHLQNHKNWRLRNLQRRLFRETGMYAIDGNVPWSQRQLTVLVDIMTSSFGISLRPHLSRLDYFLSYSKLGKKPSSGLYLEPINAIAVVPFRSRTDTRIFTRTLLHEIGHAVLFSKLTTTDLANWMNAYAGMAESADTLVMSLYHKTFLQPLMRPSYNSLLSQNFPTSYSSYNSHEWFAENFAEYALFKLKKRSKISEAMIMAFDELLN